MPLPLIIAGKAVLALIASAVVLALGNSSGISTPPPANNTQVSAHKIVVNSKRTASPRPTPTVSVAPADAQNVPDPEDAFGPITDIIADTPTRETYTPPAVAGFSYVRPNVSNISSGDIPGWINFDVVNDREQESESEESWNTWLFNFYNQKYGQKWQYQPIEVHAHWWGEPVNVPSHNQIVNYINGKDALTVNFVVSANRITSMMPLSWMATTTGYRNPYAWKMEIDPTLSEDVYKTVAALMYVVELKNANLRNEPIRLHKEFYPTGCADLDTVHLRDWVNKFVSGEYDIATGQPTAAAPAPPAPQVPGPSPSVTVTNSPTATPSPSV